MGKRSWRLTSFNNFFFIFVIIMSDLIFHLISREEWRGLEGEVYEPDSLDNEGFIHFCEKDQVEDVLEFEEASREDLVVLCVNKEYVEEELKYENGFPHLYRPLKIKEVESIREIDQLI